MISAAFQTGNQPERWGEFFPQGLFPVLEFSRDSFQIAGLVQNPDRQFLAGAAFQVQNQFLDFGPEIRDQDCPLSIFRIFPDKDGNPFILQRNCQMSMPDRSFSVLIGPDNNVHLNTIK